MSVLSHEKRVRVEVLVKKTGGKVFVSWQAEWDDIGPSVVGNMVGRAVTSCLALLWKSIPVSVEQKQVSQSMGYGFPGSLLP